jgi:hypothetical protein
VSQNPQKNKSKKALQAEIELAPPWFPDARWHLKTLGTIYALVTAAYFGISALLSTLPKPYHLRSIPVEMTPWLRSGADKHLPEERLNAPEDPTAPGSRPAK